MADEDDFTALLKMAGGLHVNLGDERAGGIEHEHIAGLGGGRHRLGDAMC